MWLIIWCVCVCVCNWIIIKDDDSLLMIWRVKWTVYKVIYLFLIKQHCEHISEKMLFLLDSPEDSYQGIIIIWKNQELIFCFLLMFAEFFFVWTFFFAHWFKVHWTNPAQTHTEWKFYFFPIKIIALFASFDHDSINGSKNRRSEKFFFSFCLVEKKFSDLIFFFLKSFSFENSYDDDDDEKKFLWFPGILLKFNYGIFALEILWKFCKNSVQNRMDYGWIFLLLLLLLFRLTINQSNQNQNKHSVVFCLRITSISFLIEWIFCWETFSEKVIRCNLFQTIWLMMNYGIFLFFIFFHHKSKSKTTEEFIFKEF